MPDPSPPVALPNAEYIELRNVSAVPVNLAGWKLSDATATTTIQAAYLLKPDSAVILCSPGQTAAFASFGTVLGLGSFPSLDNEGEELVLRSPQNRIIHAIRYEKAWYGNPAKEEGGWSLELMDPLHPCGGKEAWQASKDPSGGTPGKRNSVHGANPDREPPRLERTYSVDSVTVVLMFNEPLDSADASTLAHYQFTGPTILSATPLPPLYQQVQIRLLTPMEPRKVYTIKATGLKDCVGNETGNQAASRAGLPESVKPGDVVINEILFDPPTGAGDYIEMYNGSYKIIDASSLYIANRNSSGTPSSLKRISEKPFLLFPGSYLLLCDNLSSLQFHYLFSDPSAIMILPSLPTYADDKGTVVLLHQQGTIIDEVAYSANWHFPLIADPQGVALERLDPAGPSGQSSNWHSAASTAGYGTPGYRNSQNRESVPSSAVIETETSTISPDNDGVEDVLRIKYNLPAGGYVANIIIYNAAGRPVRYLVKNDLLGTGGFWTWDGLSETRTALPEGHYIIHSRLFNLEGKTEVFRKVVALVRKK